MSNQWNAVEYDAKHAFVYEKAKGLVELLAPKAGERILDLGCGTGVLTAEIAGRGAEILGVDRSEKMIAQARKKFPALRFEGMDVQEVWFRADAAQSDAAKTEKQIPHRRSRQTLSPLTAGKRDRVRDDNWNGAGFDAAFSNAVLHWIPEAEQV